MTQDNYVVMKKSSREKLIKELKEYKKENQQLKKQKDDVVEYIKKNKANFTCMRTTYLKCMNDLLRMLGEKDE